MKKEPVNPVLRKPIQGMNVSIEFKAMAKANGYRTLRDVLRCSVHDLPKKRESGYRMLRELLDILQENELMYLVEDE